MKKQGLYDPFYEHDSCGVGFVVNVNGEKSHQIVSDGITILKNLAHRGAIGGDSKTGDGAGMLIQIPHQFFTQECNKSGFKLPEAGSYGVGKLFLPMSEEKRKITRSLIEKTIKSEGGTILGWRDVPVRPDCLGEMARSIMPFMAEIFVTFGALSGDALERNSIYYAQMY